MYLLDTSACIVHLRSRGQSTLSRKLLSIDRRQIFVCPIVRGELIVGALKSRDVARGIAEAEALLALFKSVPFDDAAGNRFAEIRADLEFSGMPIGAYDMLIAAIALSHNLIVVTRDVGDYGRVNGLTVEDWS